jgi:rhodanese-related sulfurtransferase
MSTEMIERGAAYAIIFALSGVLVSQANARVEIERSIPMEAQVLYKSIAGGAKPQIIDFRPLEDDDNEDVGGYEYTHVPGSIPMPGCDPATTPEGALGQIQYGVPTVIVSADGDKAAYEKCAQVFSRARNLQGGMLGWMDEFLPEDEGEYVAPKAGAGGGCL